MKHLAVTLLLCSLSAIIWQAQPIPVSIATLAALPFPRLQWRGSQAGCTPARFSILQLLSFLLCTLLPFTSYSQSSSPVADGRWREAGLPYMRIYSASEYGGERQNWDIIQDRRGVMYFANQNCLLEYGGVSWRQIHPADKMIVFSLGIDTTGRIWVGAARELGYLAPDTLGYLQFTSLLAYVPAQIREAETYWNV